MATYIVTNNKDSGVGSLREAIAFANANLGEDAIEIVTDISLSGAINITDGVTISSSFGATITQTGSDRIFKIDDGDDSVDINVKIDRINITGGNPALMGGAILSYENLSIDQFPVI